MIAILEKCKHNADFHPMVDFIEASPLRTVTESSLRRNLKLQDEEGISSLPDMELFKNLTLMRYNISPNQKFTFQKEDDDDEDPEEDPVDYPADGGDDGDDEEESSEDDDDEEDDEMDVEADEEEEEEHPAPADSVVFAPTVADQAPFAKETEPFKTDESAATPPPHPAYRTTTRISIPAPVPMPAWTDSEVARLLAISSLPASPLL
nr:hypothetical protein [Tanacetum cinerariifolium]